MRSLTAKYKIMQFFKCYSYLIFGFVLLNSIQILKCEEILVNLSDSNQILGNKINILNKEIQVFLGVPYAKPPIGELRFKKPIPIDEWPHLYNATQIPPPCVNYNNGSPDEMPWSSGRETSEDCLYLNIWTPSHVKKPLSVMVWIYGGAFQTGSIDLDLYDARVLSAIGNVVVVTFNYRIGVLGLFYSGTDDAPGNVALHDQMLALKWVQTYIGAFGGDPKSVTIFGESAGSISVGIHLLSPLSNMLFKRAILQSGSPYHNIGGVEPSFALNQSMVISRHANCLSVNNEIQFDCLRNLDTNQIRHIYHDIYTKGIALNLIYGDEFSPQPPIEAINNNVVNARELIIGTNKHEGSSILFMGMPELFSRKCPMNMTKTFAIQLIKALSPNWWLGILSEQQFNAIIEYYIKDIMEYDYDSVRQSLVDLIGDSLFICPSVYLAESLSQIPGSKVFYYHFTHIKQFDNHWGKWMGSPHFDDVQYVFGYPLRYPKKYSKEESGLSLNLIKSWTSFARNGVPFNSFGDNDWPLYDRLHKNYVEINGFKRNSNLNRGPRLEECQFWKSYFEPKAKHEEL